MLAAVGCGEYTDVRSAAQHIVKVKDTVSPEPELVEKYEQQYLKFRKMYPAVKDIF